MKSTGTAAKTKALKKRGTSTRKLSTRLSTGKDKLKTKAASRAVKTTPAATRKKSKAGAGKSSRPLAKKKPRAKTTAIRSTKKGRVMRKPAATRETTTPRKAGNGGDSSRNASVKRRTTGPKLQPPSDRRVRIPTPPTETHASPTSTIADVMPGVIPATPAPKPIDPDEIAARNRLLRLNARRPLMPRGPSAPRPMPPRSSKPLWRRPHSS